MDLNKSKIRLKSQEEIDKKLQEFSGREHLYSIALFDILGFSNFVQKNGTDTIMELYTKLLDLINRRASSYDNVAFAGRSRELLEPAPPPCPGRQSKCHNTSTESIVTGVSHVYVAV